MYMCVCIHKHATAGIGISESALMAAAALSARYINGRFLPDKAIDLVDEAAAQVCTSSLVA